jgi:glutathione S-transferase
VRVLRIPHSTNADRVALALGHKRLAVEWVDVDPDDRRPVRALSGQDLVPVAEFDDGSVLADSRAILRRLEADHPDPPLWPAAPPDRAQADLFLEWFDEVWKGPPNRLAAGPGSARPGDAERLRGWTDRFEALLEDGRPYLLGGTVTVADVLAHPFLRYGAVPLEPGDADPFHAVLAEHLRIGTGPYPRLRAWVSRVDGLPRS